MEILSTLGHGLLEKPYENALSIEFQLRGLRFQQQKAFDVIYKDFNVGRFIPDFIVEEKIVVEIKTITNIGRNELAQMINYLKITQLELGLILNFHKPKLEFKRVVLQQ